jgi:hypothetical protein
MRRLSLSLALVAIAAAVLSASIPQAPPFFPIDQVKPGLVGVGRTVFAGDTLEDFKVHIIGVIQNVIGPRRDLILAKLEGGPLATTGVIQGMSGSPVYIDGRLVGALSYSLGSFPREPIAGITPIAEMLAAVDSTSPRPSGSGLALEWPATTEQVFAQLNRIAARASGAFRPSGSDLQIVGPPALANLVPTLRPIGAAMVLGGFDPSVDHDLRGALGVTTGAGQAPPRTEAANAAGPLRPGDPVGLSLIRGDLEMGATGTVTHVDGARVYAFGHPFLNLGTTTFAMTRSHVYTVLPSLETSIKIASLGPVIGTVSQDRMAAIGGALGQGPRELEVNLSLRSDRADTRRFKFAVVHDQLLTPLFTYVALVNSLIAYERQTGAMSVAASATVSFGNGEEIKVDDFFSGDTALTAAGAAIVGPIGAAATNEFRTVLPDRIDIEVRASERQEIATIERVWLDTTRPRFGATHQLQVQVRNYRGTTETLTMPVVMPAQGQGPLTLLVCDAATLTGLEQRELRPAKPASWSSLVSQLGSVRRNNRLYVRQIAPGPGTVVGGETLPGLPGTVRSVLDADAAGAATSIARTVVGAWEQRLDRFVRGSRELTLTLTAQQ